VKLDPLINHLVTFKLKDCPETLYGTIRAFDEHGYWIEGGTIAGQLQLGDDKDGAVRYLEFNRIEWLQAKTSN
jgi:hypothetical protein